MINFYDLVLLIFIQEIIVENKNNNDLLKKDNDFAEFNEKNY